MTADPTEVNVNNPGNVMVQCQLWLRVAVVQSQRANFALMSNQTERHSEKQLEGYPEVQEICFKVKD